MGRFAAVAPAVLVLLAGLVLASPRPALAECSNEFKGNYSFNIDCYIGVPPVGGGQGQREGRGSSDQGVPGRSDSGSGKQTTPGRSGGSSGPGGTSPTPGSEKEVVWFRYLPGGRCGRVVFRVIDGFIKDDSLVQEPSGCPEPKTVDKFCDRLVWDGSGLVCDKAGAFSLVRAQVSLPAISVDFSPYPAAIVGLPVQARLSGQPVAVGEGLLPCGAGGEQASVDGVEAPEELVARETFLTGEDFGPCPMGPSRTSGLPSP